MGLAIVEVVPLIGEQDAVLFSLAQFIRKPPPDMLVVVRVGVGDGRHLDQLRAAQPQHVLLLLALRVRNDNDRPVAARIGDDREPDAGIAGGRLDHEPARLEVAPLLGFENHPTCRHGPSPTGRDS